MEHPQKESKETSRNHNKFKEEKIGILNQRKIEGKILVEELKVRV